MSYVLNAIIANSTVFVPLPNWLYEPEVIDLAHDFLMVPVTGVIQARFSVNAQAPPDVLDGFYFLTQSLWERCLMLSEFGTVGFIENECFGGLCDQHSVVWRSKEVILGPLDEEGAVNKALHQLGVPRTLNEDEFDSLDLGRYRTSEEWLFGKET
jgi:hypothetical protein